MRDARAQPRSTAASPPLRRVAARRRQLRTRRRGGAGYEEESAVAAARATAQAAYAAYKAARDGAGANMQSPSASAAGASRTSYTIEKAIVVAEEAIRTGNQSAVADKYKVGSASVSRWVKRLSTLHKAAADGIRKRLRLGGGARPRCQWPKVEDKIFAELKVHRRGQPPPRPARSPPPLRLPSRLMPLVCALAGARAGG